MEFGVKIAFGFLALILLLSSRVSFGAEQISIALKSNGLAAFEVGNIDEVRLFVKQRLDSQFRIEYFDEIGQKIVRIVDLERTLEVDFAFLETYTMTPLNQGLPLLGMGPYKNAVLIGDATAGNERLFTHESLFAPPLEKMRYNAASQMADDYLEDEYHRVLTKSAAAIPLEFLAGKEVETDNYGRIKYAIEVNKIIKNYPQSYEHRKELRVHAKALNSIQPRLLKEDIFLSEGDSSSLGISLTIVDDKGVGKKFIDYARMVEKSIPIIPCRLFPTGNFYSEPEIREFIYFRLPGHSIRGFEVKALAELILKESPYVIELVAFNDCTLSIYSEEQPFYLLVPPSGKRPELFLGCSAVVDELGASSFDWMDVLFGIKEINLIQL